jgi:HrpA-like RNA helicase
MRGQPPANRTATGLRHRQKDEHRHYRPAVLPAEFELGRLAQLACSRLLGGFKIWFGLSATFDTLLPSVGKLPLTLYLLSPGHRPIQVTRGHLASGRGSWAAVKAGMKGRYPRHLWPGDSASAVPAARNMPRGT